MIRLRQAVVVEGKYDKIKLANLLDTVIITTDGFGIFRDTEKVALLKRLAQTRGLIIMTDSDSAGFTIRNYLKNVLSGCDVTNVYIPEVLGKERRKEHPSAEGLLGVEGVSERTILDALSRAGVTADCAEKPREAVTKLDLYTDGFVGGSHSAGLRKALCAELGLPTRLSANALVQVINDLCGREEYREAAEKVKRGDKGE